MWEKGRLTVVSLVSRSVGYKESPVSEAVAIVAIVAIVAAIVTNPWESS